MAQLDIQFRLLFKRPAHDADGFARQEQLPYCTINTGHPRDKRMISLAMVDYQQFAIAPEGALSH